MKPDMTPEAATEVCGWMSEPELAWLHAKAGEMRTVVEIGSWKGRSTYALCEAVTAAGMGGTVYAVDHWLGSENEVEHGMTNEANYIDIYSVFLRNVGQFGCLQVLRGDSPTMAFAPSAPKTVDMLFVDGDHSTPGCTRDLMAWGPRTTKLICGHDWSWKSVRKAVYDWFYPFGISPSDIMDGPGEIWYVPVDESLRQKFLALMLGGSGDHHADPHSQK